MLGSKPKEGVRSFRGMPAVASEGFGPVVGAERRGCSTVFGLLTGSAGESQVFGLLLSHGFSFEGDGVGIMNESVKDGVGKRGVPDGFVPMLDGELGGDQGGAAVVAVFHDFEEVSSLFVRQGRHSPVIEYEKVGTGQRAYEAVVVSGAAGDSEVSEELGDVGV